ncbi:hypothetical protein P691DRAFT_812279 [Macrolepiota fuliginosa MF-IS2]|uniref:Uncharacterized protein n=1 Tax=Macrolepiota fuliginosa MF-IS2 TaxID=1400762 RepID=A0A9P5XH91_9AGAR|nr:hypothetical protein P691DRAFT_812279 [Macrolepiota fuliginosa MF-IS2]
MHAREGLDGGSRAQKLKTHSGCRQNELATIGVQTFTAKDGGSKECRGQSTPTFRWCIRGGHIQRMK